MKNFFYLLLLLIFISESGLCQKYTFQLTNPLEESPVNLSSKPFRVYWEKSDGSRVLIPTVNTGLYEVPSGAQAGDNVLILTPKNDIVLKQQLTSVLGSADDPLKYYFNDNEQLIKKLMAGSTGSSKSYWVGAKVSYNVNGNGSDDIVGGTKIKLNPSVLFSEESQNSLAIIGNIGTFVSNAESQEKQEAISKLAQSTTGLGVGIGYIRDFVGKDSPAKIKTRMEATMNYRLNSFKDPINASESIGLNQFRQSVLFELELDKWKNEGVLTLSAEGSLSLFSKDDYNKIFSERKGNRVAFETTLIIPLSKNIGFMCNLIATPQFKPTYQFGISIKTD